MRVNVLSLLPSVNYQWSLLKSFSESTKLLLLSFFILSFFTKQANAEGTKEVMPNATNGVGMYISTTANTSGPFRASQAENRVRFYILNAATENFYFGYRAYNRAGTPAEVAIYYRIVNAAGTEIVAPVLLPTTAGTAGRINTYAEAVAGPNIGGLVPTGYSPRLFDPTANGEYYIEMYASADAGATATTGQQTVLVYFDFTVATTTNVKYPGRVYSQAWSLITYNPSTFVADATRPLEGNFYGFTGDSTVARIDYNAGFKPLAFTLYLNKYGTANTGDWVVDRRSVNTGGTPPALPGGYPVFLNTPATAVFPRSAAPATPVINKIYGCTGAFFVSYTVSMPGDIAVLLDLNGTAGYQAGTADRYLFAYDVAAGTNVLAWNGLDGLGNTVAAPNVAATLFLRRGRTNMPMYDAELNQNGLTVEGLEPASYTPKLFWDDALLTNIGSTCTGSTPNNNTTGAGIDNSIVGTVSPGRAWDGSGAGLAVPAPTGGLGSATANICDDYGNARTLNTWFWTNEVASGTGSFRLPDCNSDNDGVPDNIDLDDDNDGIPDLIENGGLDAAGDADSDGIPNYLDADFCTLNAMGVCASMDKDGDGIINSLDLDSDNDGIADIVEAGGVDTNGDGVVDVFADADGDGLATIYDSNNGGVNIANLDTDGDGIPNAYDLDSDNDGIPDVVEAGGADADNDGLIDTYSTDSDGDGWSDTVDGDVGNDGTAENTAAVLIITGADGNADGRPDSYPRANADKLGLPNPYDLDADGDGILDTREAGIADANNDGIADGVLGTDGWSDAVDALPSLNLPNTDGRGPANYLDIDADDDGITDNIEGQTTAGYILPSGLDDDGDGIDNAYDNNDAAFGGNASNGITPYNHDGTDVPDYIDSDSDNDGKSDLQEGNGNPYLTLTSTTDTDNDGLLDQFDGFNLNVQTTNLQNNVTSAGIGNGGSFSGPSGGTSTGVPRSGPSGDRDYRNNQMVLPVQFLSLTAVKSAQGIEVNWKVASEQNISMYEVQRSINGNFVTIQRELPRNASSETTYTITDANPPAGTLYYRIKEVNHTGVYSYSMIVKVSAEKGVKSLLLTPNPVASATTMQVEAAAAQQAQMQIVNTAGIVVSAKTIVLQKGTNSIVFSFADALPAGSYLLRMYVNNGWQVTSFIKN